ncbi:MAG: BrnA antitoxin family protein [Desulfovibrionaceae bacterium]|nr:BrnA antitoxin family protein [Desulfovibrionaceae bacterium]
MSKAKKTISAEELDRKFDDGEDISEYFDFDNAIRPNKTQRLTLDLPSWTVAALDKEAVRIGIPRQSLIKTLIDAGLRSAGYSNAPKSAA